MIKNVNIDAKVPVRSLKTPINIGKYYNVKMTTTDIYKCICSRAS